MWRGCALSLALLIGGYFGEAWLLGEMGIRPVTPVAWALAFFVMTGVGGVIELWKHFRSRSQGLEDGKVVRLSGRLVAAGPLVEAPLSGRRVLFYEYALRARSKNSEEQEYELKGVGMAPCHLASGAGMVRLGGMPEMKDFESVGMEAGPRMGVIAQRLAERKWARPKAFDIEAMKAMTPEFGMEGGEFDRMNAKASELFADPVGDEEAASRALKRKSWRSEETVVPVGAEVTVRGLYRVDPPRMEIGFGWNQLEYGMTPGVLESVQARELRSFVLRAAFWLALGIAAHALVYGSNGAYWREIVEWISQNVE